MKKLSFLVLLFSFLLFSCSKDSDSITGGEAEEDEDGIVKISASIGEYNEGGIADNKASVSRPTVIERTETALGNSYYLITELSTVPSGNTYIDPLGNIVRQDANRAATALDANYKYHLLVFKQSTGDFVADRVYSAGSESSTTVLQLDPGIKYTFVAYSFNSTDDISVLTGSTQPTIRTIGNYNISLPNDKELLFFKLDTVVAAGSLFNLPIVFKRMYNKVTVEIDASAGYTNVRAVEGALKKYGGVGTINLGTSIIDRSATGADIAEPFSLSVRPIDSSAVQRTWSYTSGFVNFKPTLVNGVAKIQPFGLTTLRIGATIKTWPASAPFSPEFNELTPGYQYKLKFIIIQKDEYLTHEGQDAARIAGLIWMRHNAGSDYTADPDVISNSILGRYYEWGRNTAYANFAGNQYGAAGNIGNGYGYVDQAKLNAWNATTGDITNRENNPTKNTTYDPCPSGYRVPTFTEMQHLYTAVTLSNVGSGVENVNDFSSASIWTSKNNSLVKLTFPKQGFYTAGWAGQQPFVVISNNGPNGRGKDLMLHTSYIVMNLPSEESRVASVFVSNDNSWHYASSISSANNVNAVQLAPVRCVAENSNP